MNPNRFDDTLDDTQNIRPNRPVNNTEMTGNETNSTNQNTQPQDSRNPTHTDGFTIIPPNESKRSKLLRMAQKELDDLQRFREAQQPGPIQLPPEVLGGTEPMAAVRSRQQAEGLQSKLQKKLKKEEMDRRKRQEEEEEIQKYKDIQRKKAEKLEMKKKQEQERREELYRHDLLMKREAHLQKLESSSSVPMAASRSTPTSSWAKGHEYREGRKTQEHVLLQQKKDEQREKSQILEDKQKQEEEDRRSQLDKDRQRVTSDFLDKLEARGSGTASGLLPCTSELGNVWQMTEPQDPASSPVSFPSQLDTDSTAEEDSDFDSVVTKLQSMFSFYERESLEAIVSQCNGNFQQAYDLISD